MRRIAVAASNLAREIRTMFKKHWGFGDDDNSLILFADGDAGLFADPSAGALPTLVYSDPGPGPLTISDTQTNEIGGSSYFDDGLVYGGQSYDYRATRTDTLSTWNGGFFADDSLSTQRSSSSWLGSLGFSEYAANNVSTYNDTSAFSAGGNLDVNTLAIASSQDLLYENFGSVSYASEHDATNGQRTTLDLSPSGLFSDVDRFGSKFDSTSVVEPGLKENSTASSSYDVNRWLSANGTELTTGISITKNTSFSDSLVFGQESIAYGGSASVSKTMTDTFTPTGNQIAFSEHDSNSSFYDMATPSGSIGSFNFSSHNETLTVTHGTPFQNQKG